MRLIIDYVTKLEGELETYRQKLCSDMLGRDELELLVLYKEVKPDLPKGVKFKKVPSKYKFWKSKYKVINRFNPDAILAFGFLSKSVLEDFSVYMFAESVIDVTASKRAMAKVASKLNLHKGLIVRSQYSKVLLSNNYEIDKDRIVVTHQGFDADFISSRITSDERKIRRVLTIYQVTKPYIYIDGTVCEQGNIDSVLEAFARIHTRYPEHKLLIASSDYKIGWDNKPQPLTKTAARLLELATDLKINRKVIFTGTIDSGHLPIIFSNADIFINLQENVKYSPSVINAMAANVPIVVGDLPVLKDITQNAALVASSKSIGSLVDSISDILSDESIQNQLRKRENKRVTAFSWSDTAYKIINRIDQDILGAPKPHAIYIKDNEQDKNYSTFEEKFLLEDYSFPPSFHIRDFLELLKTIRNNNYFVFPRYKEYRFILFLIIIKIFNRKAVSIVVVDSYLLKKSGGTLKGKVSTYIKNRTWIILLKLFVSYLIVSNSLFLKFLKEKYKFKKSKLKYIPNPDVEVVSDIKKEDFRKKYKLKNYVTVSYLAGTTVELKRARTLFNKIKELKNIKLIIITNIVDVEEDSSRLIFVPEEQKYDALLNSRIHINLTDKVSEVEIFEAMYAGNVYIGKGNISTEWLINTGINGYLYENINIGKIAEQIKVLVENKTHMKDIQKINRLKVDEYEVIKKELVTELNF